MRPLSAIALSLLLFAAPARPVPSPPTVGAIEVRGNAAFPSRELLSWLTLQPGGPFSAAMIDADLHRIRERYAQHGYYDLVILPPVPQLSADSSVVDVVFVLAEGRQSLVGSLVVTGGESVGEEVIAGSIETSSGTPLDEALLERDIEAVLALYDRRGFPFAQCTVDSIVRRPDGDADRMDLHLHIVEGRRMTIDEVMVEGNQETDAAVVVRETRVGAGEAYDPDKIDGIRSRLQRLGIFSDVAEPELYVRDDRGGLRIRVTEGSTNTFDGVVGYVPGPGAGEAGYVSGLIAVSMRNLFGTGRKFSFRWQRDDRLSQELAVRYMEPWLFGLPLNLGGGFFQRQQDTAYVTRVVDLKGELMVTDALSLGVLLNSETVIPSDTSGSRVFRTSALTIGIDIQYDTRDDILNPTSGARYRTDYHYGRREVSDVPAAYADAVQTHATLQRLGVDLDVYVTTFPRQVVALSLHGRELQADQVSESEMYRFGGMRTLRGYREHQFLGSRILWTNAEYRFLMGRRSFLFGFVDTGYYFRPGDEIRGLRETDAFKLGYGLGLQVETGVGIVGVSVALGQGDAVSDAKIHFGLINDF